MKKIKNSQTQTTLWWLPEGKGGGVCSKGCKYMVKVGDLMLADKYTMKYTEDIL